MQTAVTKCRLQTTYKMQTANKNCFFIKYVTTCHFITYPGAGNRLSHLGKNNLFLLLTIKRMKVMLVLNQNLKLSCMRPVVNTNNSNCTLQSTNNAQNEYKYHAIIILQRTGSTGFLAMCKRQIGLKFQKKQFGVLDNKSLIRHFVVWYH